MTDRVVLGSGSLGYAIAEALADRPGSLRVVTDDAGRAGTLAEAGIAVERGDPTDEATLRELGGVDVVVVADDDPETNVDAARAAGVAFPDALVVAYTGESGDRTESGQRARLSAVADRVVDPTAAVAEFLLDRVGEAGGQTRRLRSVLRDLDSLAVVTHDNPDPDAIASAVALERIADTAGCGADVCYYGEITHQENRAFVNLLGFELRNLDPEDDLDEYDGVALVDHSRPGVNDQLPEDTAVDIVIDHHPPRAPVEARFVDLRSDVGATSTLMVEYLERFGVPMAEDVATGLLFGIRVDTREFSREVSPADFEAAAVVLPAADLTTLERIESPSISPDTFETVASAIQNRQLEGSILLSCVGHLSDRDALAQAADRLLGLSGVTTTVVYGVKDGTIYLSARSRGAELDLGETLREAFGQIGSAGGHADMAGAQITLGVLDSVEDREESLLEIVRAVVSDRFLEAVEGRAGRTPTYAGDADEYLAPEDQVSQPGERGDPEGGADAEG